VILDRLDPTPDQLAHGTGWVLEPAGLCHDRRCVPFIAELDASGRLDVRDVAECLRMPLVHDDAHGLWALGPESGGRALATAELPEIVLPDVDGNLFDLASLRGQKVVLHAWASW